MRRNIGALTLRAGTLLDGEMIIYYCRLLSMDVHEAIKVLNQFRHRDRDTWYLRGDWVEVAEVANDDYLEQFEAIAVAEKYRRDAQSPSTQRSDSQPDQFCSSGT